MVLFRLQSFGYSNERTRVTNLLVGNLWLELMNAMLMIMLMIMICICSLAKQNKTKQACYRSVTVLSFDRKVARMHGFTFLLSDKGEFVNEERLLEIDPRGVTIGLACWSLEKEDDGLDGDGDGDGDDSVLGGCCCCF